MVNLPMSLLYLFVVFAVVLDGRTRASNFCQEVVEPIGYGCTEFTVQTKDGFVLALHRLSRINSLVGDRGESPPAVSMTSPAFAPVPMQGGDIVSRSPEVNRPAPVRGDDIVSQFPKASGPGPSSMVTPSDSTISSIDDSTGDSAMLSSASVNAPSPMLAPKALGNRNADAQHFNSADKDTHKEKRRHHSSGGSPPGVPNTSVSSNRTASDSSSEPPVVAAGSAPTSSQSPTPSSTRGRRQRTTGGDSPSNNTANPEVGQGSPVLLVHPEFFNGASLLAFVDLENRSSSLLPIKLLNDGFDVWIGHQRATYWSHGHVQLKSTDREYWNWTWDQHAQYDLSAQLLFISTETNQPVHYIGVSQAATVGAAAATDHEVAQMIRSLTLIGPTAYRGYTNSVLLEAWAYYFGLTLDSEYYATGFQNGAFNYSREFPQTGPFSAQGLRNTAIALISGPNCCLGSAPIQFTNGWDGTTSFKNLLHWQQGIRTNNFAHYDYGNPARNVQAYGQADPPAYNVEKIPRRLPILIVGGGRDWFAPPQGIRLLLSQLLQQVTFINLTNYAHYDLQFSVRRETDVYLPILQYLEGPKFQ